MILFLICFSCRKDIGNVNHGEYPVNIGKIMVYKCATSGCHDDKSYEAASGLNLSSWADMFKGSKSGSPVIPYNSRFSSLCYFINTYPDLGSQNTPVMPLNKEPLSYNEVKAIKDWIEAGAPDINGNVKWADNPKLKKLYAVNQGCDVVTVFASETQLPIRYIDVGRPGVEDIPHQLRVSPDGNYWYVIFINYNYMQKYRCSDDSYVGNIPLTPLAAGTGTADAQNWNTMILSKDSKRAYCVSWTLNGKVAAVDLENQKLIHYTALAGYPHAIALSSDEGSIFVGQQQGNYFTQIDTAFTTPTDYSIQNGSPPSGLSSLNLHDILLSPINNNELWITCQDVNEVRVFNMQSLTTVSVIPVGTYPQEIIYSSVNSQFYVSCMYDVSFPNSMGVITRINANNMNDVQKIKVGYQPHGIAVDEKTKLLYVLSRNITSSGPAPHHTGQCDGRNGFINFIDLNSHTVLSKKYELSVDPYFIYTRP